MSERRKIVFATDSDGFGGAEQMILTTLSRLDRRDWQPLLADSPAAAALYENLHYGEAGLCRTPLDAAMRAELQARQAIAAARAAAAPGTPSDAEDRP